MAVKLLLMFISTIYAVPLPKSTIQIENFDILQQNTKQNTIEMYKNILIKNLIVTSDNLKLFLNMEHSDNYPETNGNQKRLYFPDYDVNEEEFLFHDQNSTEKPVSPGFQKMKRQIGGLGGAGGDTQVVLGTFQAMMRPMSTSDIPGLGQNSQQTGNSATNEEDTNAEN